MSANVANGHKKIEFFHFFFPIKGLIEIKTTTLSSILRHFLEKKHTMAESKETIVMFPFMAQGHIIPFLALALQIEQRGFNIIFVNTPRNIKELRRAIPPCSAISLREIPFDAADHGLPTAAENTDVLPYSLVIRLLEASTSLKPAFTSLLAGLVRGGAPPLGIIADIFFGWSAEVANELGLFHAVFSGFGGFGLACYYSMWLEIPRHPDIGEHTEG